MPPFAPATVSASTASTAPSASIPETDEAVLAEDREAARVALQGTSLERAKLVVNAIRSLLQDTNDTRQVFRIGLVLARRGYPMFLTKLTLDDEGARLLRERPAIDSSAVDFDHLRALPETTLGGAYVRFLDRHGLDPDLFQRPTGLPEVPAYVSQRMRQVHDLWHVLAGYEPDIAGEIAVQAFSFGQTKMIPPALIALVAAAKFAPKQPRIFQMLIDGYRVGSNAKFLPPVWLEEHFERPLDEVRKELGIVPIRPTLLQ